MEDPRQRKRKEVEAAVVMIEDIIRDHQQNYLTISNQHAYALLSYIPKTLGAPPAMLVGIVKEKGLELEGKWE